MKKNPTFSKVQYMDTKQRTLKRDNYTVSYSLIMYIESKITKTI